MLTFRLLSLLTLPVALVVSGQPPASAPSAEQRDLPLEAVEAFCVDIAGPEADLREQPQIVELVETARRLLEGGECTRALGYLSRALELAANRYYEPLYLAALAHYRLGELGEARTFAEAAAAVRPTAADVHYLLGHILRQQGRIEPAIRHYRTATRAAADEPDNPRVSACWYWLGYCLQQAGFLAAACESYANFDSAVWETHPAHRDNEEVAGLLAEYPLGMLDLRLDLLSQLNRHEEAVRVAGQALARWPEDMAVARRYAVSLLQARRFVEAFDFCRQKLSTAPDAAARARSPLLTLAATAALEAGLLDSWRLELLEGELTSERVDLLAALARRLEPINPMTAVNFWQVVVAHRPADAAATWSLAAALRSAGRIADAASTLSEFLRHHPDTADICWAPLTAWLSPLEPTEEIRRAVDQLQSGGADFALDLVLAMLAAATGRPQQAIEQFRTITEAQPDFLPPYLAWGYLLTSHYRWEEAKTVASAALKRNPQCAAAHFILALAHAGLDENSQAEAAFRAALRYRPDEPEFALAAARHYRRTGDLLAAQRYFQQALSADPTNGAALENLIESYLAGGKSTIARAQLRQAELTDVPEQTLRRVRTTLRFAQNPFGPEHLTELSRQLQAFPDDVETGTRLAAGLFVRGRLDEALQIARQLYARHPEDERLATLLCRLHTRRLEFPAAIEILESLARRYPNRIETLMLLSENYLADFRFEDARRVLTHVLELDPDAQTDQIARTRLLASYTELSDFEGALALLADWESRDPDNPAWHREKLRILVLTGRVEQALELASSRLEPLTAQFQKGLEQLKKLLEQLQSEPDNRAARADLESLNNQLSQLQSRLQQARAELMQVCLDGQRFQKAIELARSWLEQEDAVGYEAGITQWLVQALIADGQPEAALEALEELVAETPQATIALRGWKARAHAAAGRVDQAAGMLRETIADPPAPLDPSDRADLWTQLIEIYADAGRYDDALECLDQWATSLEPRDRPGRTLLLTLRCMVLAEADRLEDYATTARELLELDPDNPGLNNDLGYTWADAGINLPEATQMIRKAVAAQPLRAAYLDSLGWAYYKMTEFEKACFWLERAARLREGQDPVIYDHWGDTHYRLGNRDAARNCWEKAAELLTKPADRPRIGRNARLLSSVREKLKALADGREPNLAPLAVQPAAEPGAVVEQAP
jgi:tetratricopeptide (TPR) repeat protein